MKTDDPEDTGSDDGVRALLGAYVLDAVDDVERRAVERLIRHDADAAREVDELRGTAAALGVAAASTPPQGLRADVLAEIARTPGRSGAAARRAWGGR